MEPQSGQNPGIDTTTGAQGGQTPPSPATSSGGSPAAPISPAAGSTGPGPASTPPGGGAAPAPATPEYASVRETLTNYGLAELASQFQDDHGLLNYLAQAHRERAQLQQYAQYGQTYLQHAQQFEAWRRQQAEEQQRAQAQQNQWWKPPEYDPRWASQLTRDPATGEIKVIPGGDPTVLQKYLAWNEHQRSFQERFAQDPIKAIQPGLEQLIDQRAQALIQQQLTGYAQQSQAQALVQNHAAWIYQRDQQGNVLRGQGGQPLMNEWGQRYAMYVQQAEQMGLRGVQAQDRYAVGMVQRDYLASSYQQQVNTQQVQQSGDALKDQFLQRAAQPGAGGIHNPNTGANGAGGPSGVAVNPPPAGNTVRNLASRMLDNFKANGYQPGQEVNLGR